MHKHTAVERYVQKYICINLHVLYMHIVCMHVHAYMYDSARISYYG